MPVTEDPTVATQLAQFGDAANEAASIKYDVPLPGAHSVQRVVPLLGGSLQFDADEADNAGMSLQDLGVYEQGGPLQLGTLLTLYQRILPATARPSLRTAADVGVDVVQPLLPLDRAVPEGEVVARAMMRRDADIALGPEGVDIQRVRREQFLHNLANLEVGTRDQLNQEWRLPIRFPAPGLGQSIQTVDYNVASAGTPHIAIVETWQVSAFLGDYGLGKTLETSSLLPGERTTITFRTWRTDAATREDASSVFDSSDTAAQSRFGSALTRESGSAFQDQGGWALSLGTKGSGGVNFGLWNIGGSHEVGFSANHQEARQQFAKSVSQTNQEHSSQVNASRRQAVESRSSTTSAAGTTQTTVREISNTNLRRVLNFVFRELNQTYEVITSLRDVRIAFYNGKVDSAEIVPLADLRRLLQKYILPAQRDELARSILAMVTECIDHTGTVHTMLEVGTREGGTFTWVPATLDNNGELDFADSPLDAQYSWRIMPGPIGQPDDEPHKVPGVVTARDTTVLRTDNIVVEALLGQADALDPYASALQASDLRSREADIEWRQAETRRTNEALNLVAALPEDQKVDAFERILGEEPDIEVVPVAAVNNDGTP